jgi:hypothetical protein
MALQRLTTREPDAEQVEVAIAALEHVLRADGVSVAGVEDADGTLEPDGLPKSGGSVPAGGAVIVAAPPSG